MVPVLCWLEITQVIAGMWYENPVVKYTVVNSFGTAQGKVRVKIFSASEEIASGDLTNFVRKDGDKMTGTLETTSRILIRPDNKGAQGNTNMLVVNQEGADTGSIARFQQGAVDVLKVNYDRTTSFEGNRVIKVGYAY